MKVIFWEISSKELITELESKRGDLQYRSISTLNQLVGLLNSDEMSVIIVDADDKFSEIKKMARRLQDQFPHCPLIISFQALPVKQVKQLQKECMGVKTFLKRPHQAGRILEIVDKYHSELLADNPADMRRGGTEDIDMSLVMSTTDPRGVKIPTEDQMQEEDKDEAESEIGETTSLESIDNEKQSFVLDDSDDEGEITVHTSSDIGIELSNANLSQLNEVNEESDSNEIDSHTDLFDLPEGIALDDKMQEEGSITDDSLALEMPESSVVDDAPLQMPIAAKTEEDSRPKEQDETSLGPGTLAGPPPLEGVLDSEQLESEDPIPPAIDIEELKKESESISQHHHDELLHLKATIENLREDRELLLKQISEKEQAENEGRYKINNLQAERDEAKIEIVFLKKRYEKEIGDLNYATKRAQEKRDILLEKNKQLQLAIDLAKGRVSFDARKIQEREKELEGQLELLKADSENLVKNRDKMILELKRKIDTLEFDFNTVSEKEKKAREDRILLEDRLERIMGTLRRTIGNLNEDLMAEKNEDQDKKLTGF